MPLASVLMWLLPSNREGLVTAVTMNTQSDSLAALEIDLFDRRIRVTLINLLIVLVLVGVLLWAINNYLPMDQKIKKILNIVVVVIVVLWLLQVFGVLGPLDSIRIGR